MNKMKKNKMMKKIAAGFLAAAMVLTTTACGSGNDAAKSKDEPKSTTNEKEAESGEATTLTMWNTFTGSDGEVLRKIVDQFNAESDSIQIDMEIMPMNNFNEQLPPAITSDTAPDFVIMPYAILAPYAANGVLKPMDDFWNFEGVDKSDFTEGSVKLGMVDDVQYFVPMCVNSLYLYWNRDLFKEAGLDVDTPPATWEELAELGAKIVDPEKNVSGYVFPLAGNGQTIFYNWLIQNGGRLVSDDYTKSEFASPETLEVLKAIQKMVVTEKVGPNDVTGPEADNLMGAGQLGMFINGPWLNAGLQANEINYGITSMPQVNAEKPFANLQGSGFSIPVSTDDSKTDAIFEFIKYWNTTEVAKQWSIEAGFPSQLLSVAEDPEVQEHPIISKLSDQIRFAEPLMPGFAEIGTINADIIDPMLERLLQGEDPETLMNEAHDAINTLLGN